METVNVKDLDYSIFENLKTQRAPRGNPHGREEEALCGSRMCIRHRNVNSSGH